MAPESNLFLICHQPTTHGRIESHICQRSVFSERWPSCYTAEGKGASAGEKIVFRARSRSLNRQGNPTSREPTSSRKKGQIVPWREQTVPSARRGGPGTGTIPTNFPGVPAGLGGLPGGDVSLPAGLDRFSAGSVDSREEPSRSPPVPETPGGERPEPRRERKPTAQTAGEPRRDRGSPRGEPAEPRRERTGNPRSPLALADRGIKNQGDGALLLLPGDADERAGRVGGLPRELELGAQSTISSGAGSPL
jgi:hypothetical protein